MRVPLPLKIADQRRTVVAIGLIPGVSREIFAEGVERLFADTDGAAVRDRADGAGAGQSGDHLVERAVHLLGSCDLVADQSAFRAVAGKLALVLDRLPRDAVAGEARHAQICGARNDALL